jgi:hypothetical protein
VFDLGGQRQSFDADRCRRLYIFSIVKVALDFDPCSVASSARREGRSEVLEVVAGRVVDFERLWRTKVSSLSSYYQFGTLHSHARAPGLRARTAHDTSSSRQPEFYVPLNQA